MKKSLLIRSIFISLGFVVFISPVPSQNKEIERPNIIIILADDMGFGDVSYYNPHSRTKTPNIDKMAERSINFTDAHAGGSVCIPSRYGLLTGRYYFRVSDHKLSGLEVQLTVY